jgi:hypothetical protein
MRKILLVATSSAAAVIAFGVGAAPALASIPSPSQTTCYGTAGYDSTGTWSFNAVNPTVQTPAANPSPDACVNIPEDTSPSPFDALAVPGNITLSGTGNLSCGNGTISGTVGEVGGAGDWWGGSFSATFQNGVGQVTGTVTPLVTGGQTAALSGTIHEADGGSGSGVGVCNNDSNPSPTTVSLTVS